MVNGRLFDEEGYEWALENINGERTFIVNCHSFIEEREGEGLARGGDRKED